MKKFGYCISVVSALPTALMVFLGCASLSLNAAEDREPVSKELSQRPNVLLLVGDDMGLGELEPFGSEINTPALSMLAEKGARFTNFHVSPVCSVTRSKLLTGANSIEVGLGAFDYSVYPPAKGKPGYEGYLTRNTAMLSEILYDAGYNTYHVGKWHLGGTHGGHGPHEWGFSNTYGVLPGGSAHWNAQDMVFNLSAPESKAAIVRGEVPPKTYTQFLENGEPVERPEGIYSDDLYVGKMIEYIEGGRKSGRPFFGYVAFTTAHFPIQAPSAMIDKYVDTYRELGYEGVKELRYKRMKEMGIYPESAPLPPRNPITRDWAELSDDEKDARARLFGTFAAMVESQDHHIGRLMDYLRETGQLENTLVIYLTDNGPEGADAFGPLGNEDWTDWVETNYSMAVSDIGTGKSNRTIGMEWANAATGTLQWWKWFVGEGGVRVPLIIVPPANRPVAKPGSISDTTLSVKDISATIFEYIGVDAPSGEFRGREIVSPSGKSMVKYLEGKSEYVRSPEEWFAFELFGNMFVIASDYKAIRVRPGMYGDGEWHLYDIRKDPGETKPLEKDQPERLAKMVEWYEQYAAEHNIVPVADDWNAFTEAGH